VAAYGKMAERSKGKDTTTGHWELAGIILDNPFPVYADGFPPEIIKKFEAQVGRPVLGNNKASGTEIIQVLGEEHMLTGRPIVYTSADSVFQIAAHEDIVPLELLYQWCVIARELLREEHAVGRVIARPFTGKPGDFQRTPNRKDYSLMPPSPTLLDKLKAAGQTVVGIGKIPDIYAGCGITDSLYAKSNDEGMQKVQEAMDTFDTGLIFTNLVDFDMIYGHRNDADGYARALERFDVQLNNVLKKMKELDILFIVADHGCDPTFPNTDHTREYVPILAYGKQVRPGSLGVRQSMADLGATVAHLLGLPPLGVGEDFTSEMELERP
jgi:phosphopentomutase